MEIKEVSLLTSKLEEMKRFYVEKLSIPLYIENEQSFTLKIGNSKLEFVDSDEDSFYHFAFNIPNKRLMEAKNWLEERTEILTEDGEEIIHFPSPWDAKAIYFLDPSGNIVELIERERLNQFVDEEFSGTSLLNISEIGIPVDNPEEFKTLLNDLNIPVFRDFEQFKALGDENGLFIVVNKERKWFMGNRAPVISEICVTINGDNTKLITIPNYPYKIKVEA
ncbi:VOC family protein [Ornithinibacillus sp. 179-J 7C1 HS]|uniref:VOC family protein n=1 Tax=Ornithinibacillus sp. 179-J 7C1 HS TaxID=3142384 RepID=UPI0039A2EEF2